MLRLILLIIFISISGVLLIFTVSYVYRPCTKLCDDAFWQSMPTVQEIRHELKYWENVNGAPKASDSRTPRQNALQHAIRHQSILGIQELLAAGALADLWQPHESFILHSAVATGNIKIVEMLLGAGADINHRRKVLTGQISSKTVIPIDAAFGNKDRKMILFLLGRGSELGRRFYGVGQALSDATRSKDYDYIIFLLSLSDDVCAQANYDPLANFARSGSLEALRYLVRHQVPVDGCGSEFNPIVEVASATTLDPTHFLLKHGASIFDRDENGNGYLHNAARNKNWQIMKFGIDAGLDVNAVNNANETALHVAASSSRKNDKQIKMLLEAGADVNAVSYRRRLPVLNPIRKKRRDSYRTTPLLLAVEGLHDRSSQLRKSNDLTNVEAICAASPNTNFKDDNGNRAMDYAIKRENRQLIEVLRKCVAKLD